jgi:hypothetical protein
MISHRYLIICKSHNFVIMIIICFYNGSF